MRTAQMCSSGHSDVFLLQFFQRTVCSRTGVHLGWKYDEMETKEQECDRIPSASLVRYLCRSAWRSTPPVIPHPKCVVFFVTLAARQRGWERSSMPTNLYRRHDSGNVAMRPCAIRRSILDVIGKPLISTYATASELQFVHRLLGLKEKPCRLRLISSTKPHR